LEAVADACSCSVDAVMWATSQIFERMVEIGKQGQYCAINLGVGSLVVYPNGSLQFLHTP